MIERLLRIVFVVAGCLLFLPLPPKRVFWKSLFFVLLFLALALFPGRLAYYRMFHVYASCDAVEDATYCAGM